jgi:hypothetical protein
MYSDQNPTETQVPKRTTIHFKAPGVEFSAEGIEEEKVLPTIEYLQQQNNKQALSELEQYRRYDGLIVLVAIFVGMFSFVLASTAVRYIPRQPSGVIENVQK